QYCAATTIAKGDLMLSLTSPSGQSNVLHIPDALKIPGLRTNLVSEDALVRLGITIVRSDQGTILAKSGSVEIHSPLDSIIYQGSHAGRSFSINGKVADNASLSSCATFSSSEKLLVQNSLKNVDQS